MLSHIIFLLRELLCDLEVRQKYQRLITNSFVQDHPNLKWCPAPGCPNAVLATNIEYAPISCTCGHFFWYRYIIMVVSFFLKCLVLNVAEILMNLSFVR